MKEILEQLPTLAKKDLAANKYFFTGLNKKQIRQLDVEVQELHEEVFDEIDCLECANCCKTSGPHITNRDIEKMSKALRISSVDLITQYLRIDDGEDGGYVFKEMPCPFLASDNYCLIYDSRPSACREYPYTNCSKFYQIRELTMKNAETCPAVYEILKRLRQKH